MLTHKVLRSIHVAMVGLLLCAMYASTRSDSAMATQLPVRSVRLSSGVAGNTTNHTVGFTYIAGSTVGSVAFQYCSNSPIEFDVCTAPTGLDTSSASLVSQSGLTGYSISASTNANTIVINRVVGVVPSVASTYEFGGIVNPTQNSFTYIRIQLYDAQDGLGTPGDSGSVVFAVNPALSITAYVPPYLKFCAGRVVALDCSSITGDPLVNMGLFSTTGPATTTSEFSGGTNITSGYTVSVLGSTMTAGTYTISPLITPASSIAGTSQFGINLRANTLVSGSSDKTGLGVAMPTANYNTPNVFAYNNNAIVASASGPTHYNRFTVSYVVNIPNNQKPGLYATTLSYVAVANL